MQASFELCQCNWSYQRSSLDFWRVLCGSTSRTGCFRCFWCGDLAWIRIAIVAERKITCLRIEAFDGILVFIMTCGMLLVFVADCCFGLVFVAGIIEELWAVVRRDLLTCCDFVIPFNYIFDRFFLCLFGFEDALLLALIFNFFSLWCLQAWKFLDCLIGCSYLCDFLKWYFHRMHDKIYFVYSKLKNLWYCY